MLFSSLTFLFYFLPVFILCYSIVPQRLKNTVLLIGSLFFYAWGEPAYILLMAIMIGAGYGFGIWIEAVNQKKKKRLVTALSVTFCLVVLGYFKYAGFVIGSLNRIPGLSLPLFNVALPIGISFYTFQMMSYFIDVYRGRVAAQKNFVKLATYIAMFPQLIAGPIVRYQDLEAQLDERSCSVSKTSAGIRRFVIGLGKKVILANTLGEICGLYTNAEEQAVLFVWLYAVSATLQIYFDFSGYSDMAIGLGKILGFDFPENFDYPLISKSITEFWRRWHMTLGSWFRDYLYIPLGGNRVPKLLWMRNILIVWMATGLWHGANWTFVLWGLYFAFFLVVEKYGLKKALQRVKLINHIYLLFFITVSFVIFNAADLADAFHTIRMMFGFGNVALTSVESIFYLKDYLVILLIGCLGATKWPKKIVLCILKKKNGARILNLLEPLFLAAIFLISLAFLVNGSFNPFLYFRF